MSAESRGHGGLAVERPRQASLALLERSGEAVDLFGLARGRAVFGLFRLIFNRFGSRFFFILSVATRLGFGLASCLCGSTGLGLDNAVEFVVEFLYESLLFADYTF